MTRTGQGTDYRTYIESHPWLTFSLDLRPARYRFWLLLGEAVSKTEHLLLALIRPQAAQELQRVYLVKGALATTAIEGNTLSEEEVSALLDKRLRLPPSKAYLGTEVENILGAFTKIQSSILLADADEAVSTDLTVEQICEYNRLTLDGLDLDEDAVAGRVRRRSVVVGDYRGAPAGECEYLLQKLCDWLNSDEFNPGDDDPQWHWAMTLIKACVAHLYIAWIHPFDDGNGRTARLVEFHILLAEGFPAPACQLLSNHYNLTRTNYYRQLRASSAGRDPVPFLHYAVQGYVDGLREQIDRVWSMQYADRWEQLIYETFGERTSEAQRRQLRLVKDISTHSIQASVGVALPDLVPVHRSELRHLSPKLAELYQTKTEKTLSRDIAALQRMDLLLRTEGGFVPNSDLVLGLMPLASRARHRHPLFAD